MQTHQEGHEDIIEVYRAIVDPLRRSRDATGVLSSVPLCQALLDQHGIATFGQLARHMLLEQELVVFGAR